MATAKVNAIRKKKNAKRVVVGRNDGQPIPGTPGNVVTARFRTIVDGELFIDKIKENDLEGVKKGKYFIDVPEDMQVQAKRRGSRKGT